MNKLSVALIDLLLLHLGYVLTFLVRYQGTIPAANFPAYLSVAPWLSLAAVIWFQLYGLYDVPKKRWNEIFYSLFCVTLLIAVSVVFLSFIGRQFAFPRTVIAISPLIHLLLFGFWRYYHWRLMRRKSGVTKIIVVGDQEEAQRFAGKIIHTLQELVAVQGLITVASQAGEAADFPVLGDLGSTRQIIAHRHPDCLYICAGMAISAKEDLIQLCLSEGIDVQLVPDLYDIFLANSALNQIDDTPVFQLRSNGLPAEYLWGKRVLDIVLSSLILILAAPLMLLAAVLIKMDSPGPVFLSQERLSVNGNSFRLLKFRTMVDDAEKLSGPVLAEIDDPRITRVGKFLRRTRFDEVPQLLNVLKGEMSVVGPRPERPYFVERFSREIPAYSYRLEMKAGVTGLAQVAGKYSTTPEDKLRYDLLYSRTHSPFLDLVILLHTVRVMLMRDQAS